MSDEIKTVTRLAIQAFEKVVKLETKLEMAEAEQEGLMPNVPDEDMDVYMEKTERIVKIEDEKLQTFNRRLEKRQRKELSRISLRKIGEVM